MTTLRWLGWAWVLWCVTSVASAEPCDEARTRADKEGQLVQTLFVTMRLSQGPYISHLKSHPYSKDDLATILRTRDLQQQCERKDPHCSEAQLKKLLPTALGIIKARLDDQRKTVPAAVGTLHDRDVYACLTGRVPKLAADGTLAACVDDGGKPSGQYFVHTHDVETQRAGLFGMYQLESSVHLFRDVMKGRLADFVSMTIDQLHTPDTFDVSIIQLVVELTDGDGKPAKIELLVPRDDKGETARQLQAEYRSLALPSACRSP